MAETKPKLETDPKKAEQEAYAVKDLVGREIDEKFEEMKAVSQFTGLENEIVKIAGEIKGLHEGAVAKLEETRWSEVMRISFEALKQHGYFDISKYFKDRGEPEKTNEFAIFLETRFEPKLFEENTFKQVGPRDWHLIIKGTTYVFSVSTRQGKVELLRFGKLSAKEAEALKTEEEVRNSLGM